MAGDAPSPGPGSPGTGPDQADNARSGPYAAPLALYRRYRPASFAEVKGQDHVTEPLRQALRSGRVHHAYLFSGPRGCGKTSSARILARSLNCEQGPTPDPCGVCASCVALAPSGPGSIDVIEIDAASHGGVDDARDLRERAFYSPVSGRYKIYIIDEAHMVTGGGFNALLKLVEEPPPHLKFVFATTEPEKVIATIRSRTHHYPFRLVPPAVLREHLEQILASEGVPYEPAVLPIVIRSGAGSVRDALSVLDQLIAGSDESGLRYDRAIALLGYTDDRLLDEVIGAFVAEDGAAVFRAIDHVVEAGHDPRRFAADLLDRLRDLIVISAVPEATASGLIDAPPDRAEELGKQASAFGRAELTRAAEIISAGLVEMRGATSPRLLLELMCAQVLLPAGGTDAAGLADRLDRLERRLAADSRPAVAPAAPASAPPASSRAASSRAADSPAAGAPVPMPEQRPTERGTPAPGRPGSAAPGPAPATAAANTAAQPGVVPASASAPRSGEAPADTQALRTRWPDVLAAVQGRKRVAWMQLSNASVESFADGVLTLAFAQAGVAKGFLTGGYDKDLGQVLADMFGMTPIIRTAIGTARDSGAGAGPGYSSSAGPTADTDTPPADELGRRDAARSEQADSRSAGNDGPPPPHASAQHASTRAGSANSGSANSGSANSGSARSASTGSEAGRTAPVQASTAPTSTASGRTAPASTASGRTAPASTASGRTAPASTARGRIAPASTAPASTASGRTAPASTASGRTVPGHTGPAGAADNEPAPGDAPAPDMLTGTDLIERELGGRIIQELDGP
jgi:DNA polymerase III subunit gamma/tau